MGYTVVTAAHPEEPVEMEPYPVFQMYAGEDENLDYDEFSALLDRFDIEMIEDKRRMFFAKVLKVTISFHFSCSSYQKAMQ